MQNGRTRGSIALGSELGQPARKVNLRLPHNFELLRRFSQICRLVPPGLPQVLLDV